MAKSKTEKTATTAPLQPSFMAFKPDAGKVKSAYVQKDRPSEPCWAKVTFARNEDGSVKTELPRAFGDWQKPLSFVVTMQLFQDGKLERPFYTMDYTWEEYTVALTEEEIATEFPGDDADTVTKRANILKMRGEQFSSLLGKLQKSGVDKDGNELSEEALIANGAGYILAPGNVFYAVWCPRPANSKNMPKNAQVFKRDNGVLIPLFRKTAGGDIKHDEHGKPIPVLAYNQDQICLVAASTWGHGPARDLRQYARALSDGAKYREANGGNSPGGQDLPPGVGDDADVGADPGHVVVED